jgi:hypothetical protein
MTPNLEEDNSTTSSNGATVSILETTRKTRSYKTELGKMTDSRNYWRKIAFVELAGIVFLTLTMIAIVLITKS